MVMVIEQAQKEVQDFFKSKGIAVDVECVIESEERKHLKVDPCLFFFKDEEWLVLKILKRNHPYPKEVTLTTLVGKYPTLAEALLDNAYFWRTKKPV